MSASATKSPVLLVDSVTSSAVPVDVGQDQARPASTLAFRLAPADGARASAASSAQAPSTSATIAAYRPSLITDAAWQRPPPHQWTFV